jgi:multidrug efflux pump subunit AcrA (membrane-fusion protein)
MKLAKLWRIGAALAVVAALGAGAWRVRRAQAATDLPVAPARKGDFLVIVRCRGELKARRSVQLIAPVNVPNLQIVWMAPSGSTVKAGDTVVRFDTSSAKQQLQEKEAGLRQAQATLDQALAQQRITSEQDKLDLSAARYELERARLEVSKAEIVSALQGEESRIDLGLSEQKLRVQESTVKLHQASDTARLGSLTRLRDQAQADVNLMNRRLAQMELKTPSEGIVLYLTNNSQGWLNAKPFKVGDNAWPGSALAEIPDLKTLEMEARLEEIDRGRVLAGQQARVHIDALPEKTLNGKITGISPLTEQNFEWPPTRNFRAYSDIDAAGAQLRPAMNGNLDVVVNRLPGAISVPAKALFTRDGKPIVYVASNKTYTARNVELLARNPDEVAVRGVDAGDLVTLAEPPTEPK